MSTITGIESILNKIQYDSYQDLINDLAVVNSNLINQVTSNTHNIIDNSYKSINRKNIQNIGLSKNFKKNSYFGVIVGQVPGESIFSEVVFYVDVPPFNKKIISHPDNLPKDIEGLKEYEDLIFQNREPSFLGFGAPSVGYIVEVKVPENYPNHILSNKSDAEIIKVVSDRQAIKADPGQLPIVRSFFSGFSFGNSSNVVSPTAEPTGDFANAPLADERSERVIASLDPRIKGIARQFLSNAKQAGFKIIITDGTRTIANQNAKYAQGRTAGGSIVTNAKGGDSPHNFGLAFDFTFLNENNQPYWDNSLPYGQVAALGEKLGLQWGGRWPPPKRDNPHLELPIWKQVWRDWKNGKIQIS